MNILANDLKVKGIGAIDAALKDEQEAIITLRGKPKYVTIDLDRYNQLREYELIASLAEVRAEVEQGDFKIMTADEHIAKL